MAISEQKQSFQLHLQDLTNRNASFLETIYALANGHLGVRASNPLQGNLRLDEGMPGLFVNGFYDLSHITYGESYAGYPENNQTIAQLPDPRYLVIEIDGERSDQTTFATRVVDKNLDMETGLLNELFEITTPSGKILQLSLSTFASQADDGIYCVSYTIRPINFSGAVKLYKQHPYIDQVFTRDGDIRAVSRNNILDRQFLNADFPAMQITTQRSQLGLVLMWRYLGEDSLVKFDRSDGMPKYVMDLDLQQGLTESFDFGYSVGRIHSLMDVAMNHTQYLKNANAHLEHHSFSTLFTESAHKMQEFWHNSDIRIDGDPETQKGIRFNLFHLHQSAGHDGKTSIPAKGLTGAGYEGHYFWDTEMFMLPAFIYTDPQMARALLTYRYHTLDEARRQARDFGLDGGAMFAWRTINGMEASPYFPAGLAAVHINADIAYAVAEYVQVTDDQDFLVKMGFELILETARFWQRFGSFGIDGPQGGKFVINKVTGPDEYSAMVNNNYYTNRMAQHNLRLAVSYAKELKRSHPSKLEELGVTEKELQSFTHIADSMYLPFDKELGVKMQDDGAFNMEIWPFDQTPRDNYPLLLHYHPMRLYRHQVNKQADTLMSDLLFPADQDIEQLKRDFDYYEPLTTHDSSLSRPIFSILAHRILAHHKAYRYIAESILTDLNNSQGNSQDGVHVGNMGASWMEMTLGVAGMIRADRGLEFHPHLPVQWSALTFKIRYRGSQFEMHITRNQAHFSLIEGDQVTIYCDGQEVALSSKAPVKRMMTVNLTEK
ncbi:glycoside hydrolase family 65 protein [Furfurilactobacillus rossiae]|uniref:glycoside hydrolase family 65 protein n=1 Tax=Furfurilactobacillus rossiae TaxID=231049 RepID=UPI003B983BBF